MILWLFSNQIYFGSPFWYLRNSTPFDTEGETRSKGIKLVKSTPLSSEDHKSQPAKDWNHLKTFFFTTVRRWVFPTDSLSIQQWNEVYFRLLINSGFIDDQDPHVLGFCEAQVAISKCHSWFYINDPRIFHKDRSDTVVKVVLCKL